MMNDFATPRSTRLSTNSYSRLSAALYQPEGTPRARPPRVVVTSPNESVVIVVPTQKPSQPRNGSRRVCSKISIWGWSVSVLFLLIGVLAGRYLIPRIPGPDHDKIKSIEANCAKLATQVATLAKERDQLVTERDELKQARDNLSGSQSAASRLQLDATKKELKQAREDFEKATAEVEDLTTSLEAATAEEVRLSTALADVEADLAATEDQLLKVQKDLDQAAKYGVIFNGKQHFRIGDKVKVKGRSRVEIITSASIRKRSHGYGQEFVYKLKTDREPRTSEELILVARAERTSS
jgi:septal ring factor EnvC (AmiA/AmiB activator)